MNNAADLDGTLVFDELANHEQKFRGELKS